MSCQEFPRRFGLSAAGLGIGCVVRYKSLMQLPYAFWLRTIGHSGDSILNFPNTQKATQPQHRRVLRATGNRTRRLVGDNWRSPAGHRCPVLRSGPWAGLAPTARIAGTGKTVKVPGGTQAPFGAGESLSYIRTFPKPHGDPEVTRTTLDPGVQPCIRSSEFWGQCTQLLSPQDEEGQRSVPRPPRIFKSMGRQRFSKLSSRAGLLRRH
jgi:hypothetical protein